MVLYDKIIIAVDLAGAVLLYILAMVAVKRISSKWRAFYCIPVIIALFIMTVAGFDAYMSGAYLGVLILLTGFFIEDKKLRQYSCAIAVLLGVITIPLCTYCKGYRSVDYVKDFEEGLKSMKEHYILAEHKGIDWDTLQEKYLPVFQATTREQDEVANYIAWSKFTAEFHDGHVGFFPEKEEIAEKAYERGCGVDYGMSLMKLSDGRVVAVNVEKNDFFQKAGIGNGTVITSWNGMTVEEAAEKSVAYQMIAFADKDNQMFWQPCFAAGIGNKDSVTITYLDKEEQEQTLELPKLGNYYKRLRSTMDIINQGAETGHMTWVEVAEDTVLLRIKEMAYDNETSKSEKYDRMQNEIRGIVKEYKEQDMTHLILDLRDNGGGSGQMVKALASLFAQEGTHYYCTDGLWDDKKACYLKEEGTGAYLPGKEHYFNGENIWGGDITILVNSNSISAADHLVKIMQGMEHVTIMGFTESNGSAQGMGGCILKSGILSFSNALVLDEKGGIFVDSGADRESGNDIDVRVDFNMEAVQALFDEGKDYLLQKCLGR